VARGTSKEAISRAAGHVIPHILWNSKFHYGIHNRRLLYSLFFILPNGRLFTVPISVRSVGLFICGCGISLFLLTGLYSYCEEEPISRTELEFATMIF